MVNLVTISNIPPQPSKDGAFKASFQFVAGRGSDIISNQSAASLVIPWIEF